MAQVPRILIIGVGAVGSFYGALLKRAGCHVEVVARTDYEQVKANGISVQSPLGDLSWQPDAVWHHDAAGQRDYSAPDYLLLCVKVLPDLDRAALVAPWMGERTCLALIENGLDIEAPLVAAFPNNPFVSGLAFVAVSRNAPGKIVHQAYGRLALGAFPQGQNSQSEHLASLFRLGGVDVACSDDIVHDRWKKTLWNAAFNPLSVLTNGAHTESMLNAEDGEWVVRSMMAEVIAVAASQGYTLSSDLIDTNIESTRAMGAYYNSMALDFLHQRPVELDAILGNVLALAKRSGIATPCLRTVMAALAIREKQTHSQ